MPLRLVISRSHRCTRSPRTSLKPRAASGELPSRLLNKLNRLAHERPIALAFIERVVSDLLDDHAALQAHQDFEGHLSG